MLARGPRYESGSWALSLALDPGSRPLLLLSAPGPRSGSRLNRPWLWLGVLVWIWSWVVALVLAFSSWREVLAMCPILVLRPGCESRLWILAQGRGLGCCFRVLAMDPSPACGPTVILKRSKREPVQTLPALIPGSAWVQTLALVSEPRLWILALDPVSGCRQGGRDMSLVLALDPELSAAWLEQARRSCIRVLMIFRGQFFNIRTDCHTGGLLVALLVLKGFGQKVTQRSSGLS